MATFEFKLPDLGEGVVEGEIVKWLVKPGDQVVEDQPLAELMTDKATVSVPAPRKGKVLKTHGQEGEMAKVHQILVTLDVEGEGTQQSPTPPHAAPGAGSDQAIARTAPGAAEPAASEDNRAWEHPRTTPPPAKVLATPVTRRMAREHGLDLAGIPGSGPQGRVTKVDVLAAINGSGAVATQSFTTHAPAPLPPLTSSAEDERIPLKGLRKKIAEKMVRSKHSAPHFTFVEEMDATELVKLRKRLNDSLAAAGETTKISFLPFLCKALVASLRQYPALNANFDEARQEHVIRKQFNFGIAAATDDGLTVAVVKDVDRLSLRQLASEIARLGSAAREKRLKMDELTGGTFTITSLGQMGGLFATPIINHPEVGILGVHKMRKRPVVKDDQIVIREMMYLSLSFDHRVIDGSVGAEFTYSVIRQLENPELLFLEMT